VAWPARALRGGSGRARRGRAGEAGPSGRVRLAAAGGRGRAGQAGGGACERAGLARGIYLAQPRHGSGRGTAAPSSVARQDLPRHRSPRPAHATSTLCRATIHDTTQAFDRVRAIGTAKSVCFFKKITVLDLKLVTKKC